MTTAWSPEREYDVVCLSHLRWDFVWQRPQHLMSRCARSHRVFFFEEVVHDEGDPWLEVEETPSGVFVCKPHVEPGLSLECLDRIQQTLLDELFVEYDIDDYVLWVYAPMATVYAEHLKPIATVYDCMDELAGFADAPPELREREAKLFETADVVFTGGHSLYEAKRDLHENIHPLPSSVEVEHFATARETTEAPADQAAIPSPRLGYFGVIDERLDLDLVASVADARPEWQLVLVGPVVKIGPEALPQRPNIHYLGAKQYDELPAYVAGWDAALMPFALNEATRFISPTKTLEYLAAGKRVISTPIRDVVRPYGEQGLVSVAEDAESFVDFAEAALSTDDLEWLGGVDELLAQTSWDRTWARMHGLVDESIGATTPARPRGRGRRGFDWMVVGAGYAGSVLAERLASQTGARVLVVERRNHVGGNAYDHYDEAGVLVHRYGPHIFHTNSKEVFDYLSRFTDWRRYEHRVRASVDGQLVPMPINLDTINMLYGTSFTALELEEFLESLAEPVERLRTSEDVVVSKVGRDLYEKFFRNYTRKQWGLDPSELDASVTARVPTRLNRDDRYFTDTYQAMPLHGYTRMFERMLDHPNIKVMLQTDYREVADAIPYDRMVYTGPVDEFFDLRFGKLPYRSLEFRFETHDEPVFQPAPVVNFPNEHPYTRCTEFKYLTGQEHARTTVVYEYPQDEGDPYYPVPRPENKELYERYKALADATPGVVFVGRLATYKYYNMDQVVAQALAVFRRVAGPKAPAAKRLASVNGEVGDDGGLVARVNGDRARPRRVRKPD
jgi:UDP-galactopyranose mutase